MARTFDSRRRANERQIQRRLLTDQRRLAQAVGLLLQQAATRRNEAGQAIIPNTRQSREALTTAIWERVLRPYYLGPTGEPLRGTAPQSPYARLLVDGVIGAVRLQVQQQTALIRRLCRDEVVLAWLTGPRPLPSPVQETLLDSFTQWVDPRGFRLGDRIVRMAIEARSRVNRFLEYHLGRSTPAAEMATAAEQFLTTGERQRRPYGQQGGFPAQRLVRNEVVAAGGLALQNASQVNPFVRAIQWVLDPAHPRVDVCDGYASGGPDGDGVYSFELVPSFPAHPLCICHLYPVQVANPAIISLLLRQAIAEGDDYAQELRGLFNDEWMTQALVSGEFQGAAQRVQAVAPAVPAAVKPQQQVVNLRQRLARLSDEEARAELARLTAAIRQAEEAGNRTLDERLSAERRVLIDVLQQRRRAGLRYRPRRAQLDRVHQKVDQWLKIVADRYQTTPAEIERIVSERMAQVLDDSPLAVNFYSKNMDSLLADGRFKSQFETKTSGAILNVKSRANAEELGLGIPENVPAAQRPIYGFLRVNQEADTIGYGDITFVFKEDVRRRATYTTADSLYNFAGGEVAGTPITSPGRASWDGWVEALHSYASDEADLADLMRRIKYFEVQIQNGVSLADVSAVIDRKGLLTAAQREALQARGIEILER